VIIKKINNFILGVAEGVRNGQIKHKQHLNKQYMIAIHRLIDLMKYKTNYLSTNTDDINVVLERFQMLDNKCQSSLNGLDQNHHLTSSLIVAQFIEQLTGIENEGDNSTIAAIFLKLKPPSATDV
jgi:hypothetical protein